MGRFHDAEPCFRRFLQRTGDTAEGHFNLATSLVEPNQLEEAIVGYQQAIRLNPDFPEAHNNLGLALSELTAWEAAEHCYQRALALRPDYADAHLNQSLAWLVQGDFQRGWLEYEWRLRTSGADGVRDVHRPLWNGQPLPTATILLQAEQGLGDTLQFIRYAPLVKQCVARVFVECEPELVNLLKSMPGIDRLIPRGETLPEFDVHAPLLSLPGIFETELDTIPADVPYLWPAESLLRQWQQTLPGTGFLKVGVVWQGSPQHRRDRWRSIPLEHFSRLAALSGVQLYSIQVGAGREQIKAFSAADRLVDLADQIHDFHDTAAILRNLDLLISCDSAPAHLAGAMGRPVWVALPYSPDWRWLLGREDTPWYPTMRLFRQRQPADWAEVFQRIAMLSTVWPRRFLVRMRYAPRDKIQRAIDRTAAGSTGCTIVLPLHGTMSVAVGECRV